MRTKTCTRCGKRKPISEFRGDNSRKSKKHSWCKECARAYRREYYVENKERLNANRKNYPRKRYPAEVHRGYQFKYKYKITLEAYQKLFRKQKGKCKICKRRGTERLQVDHDHETGKVRALLCKPCNIAIGLIGEDPKIASAVLNYLNLHKGYTKK